MKEIFGNNLGQFFNNEINVFENEINGNRTYKGDRYEVWEVSDDVLNAMCDMSEEKFVELAGEDAWWRSAEGSNQGVPDNKYIINDEEIIAWDGRCRCEYYDDYCEDCEDRMSGVCEASDKDIESCWGERKYNTLSDYLCDEIGTSQPRNVCALAVDLAKYNNVTMGELFAKYEG